MCTVHCAEWDKDSFETYARNYDLQLILKTKATYPKHRLNFIYSRSTKWTKKTCDGLLQISDRFLKHNQQDATYTIFFIVVSALHVSSGFSAHHQELKNSACSIGYLSKLFAATAVASIQCCMQSFWAPDDERKNRSKHVKHWQQ